MSKIKKRRRYDRDYKLEAVRMVTEEGMPLIQVARNLDIHPGLLQKWRDEYSKDPSEAFPGKGKLKSEAEEIRKLKHELADAREEVAILKKAVSIFSRTQD